MSTPTPPPWIAEGYDLRQKNGRMIAYFGPHHTPADEYPMSCRLQDEANCQWVANAHNELAAAKGECERLKFASEGHLLKTIQQQAELARLRADNLTAHQMACAAGLERDQLRAEVKRLKGLASWANTCIHHNDAERARYGHVCLVCTSTRAEKAEAALAEWSVLNLWGGTPEIIHEFIKGQQNRIHHCQDLEAECLEQARLLGMSGEREADLLGKIERLAKDKARLDWLEEKMWFVRANVMLHDEVPPYTVKTCDGIVHGATVRAAIDAAMKP